MPRTLALLSTVVLFMTVCSTPPIDEVQLEEDSTSELRFVIDVVYGHDHGMAMTFDVYLPAQPNGAGVILINSGGWKSPLDTFKVLDGGKYRFTTDREMFESESWHVLSPKLLVSKAFTVFEVRRGLALRVA